MIACSFGVSPFVFWGGFLGRWICSDLTGSQVGFECVFDLQSGGLRLKSCPRYHIIL